MIVMNKETADIYELIFPINGESIFNFYLGLMGDSYPIAEKTAGFEVVGFLLRNPEESKSFSLSAVDVFDKYEVLDSEQ